MQDQFRNILLQLISGVGAMRMESVHTCRRTTNARSTRPDARTALARRSLASGNCQVITVCLTFHSRCPAVRNAAAPQLSDSGASEDSRNRNGMRRRRAWEKMD